MYKKLIEEMENLAKDNNHRYKSWEHCYLYFKNRSRENREFCSLHLFAYLASWGMLRGSSFLMQKDYKVLDDIVDEILNPKYDQLQDITPSDYTSMNIELIFELKQKIHNHFKKNTQYLNGKITKGNPGTDTLVSKILLGTLACVPAYDRFCIDALKYKEIKPIFFRKKSLLAIKHFYNENIQDFTLVQKKINSITGMNYPMIKIFDMTMWQLGFNLVD